ncbi:Low conductance mechanosensitive channel YnaI [Phycisphaerales bacterium]|nr:Low conductance mechanosensitive channel YnaI [Phycisphaerales bacterium]
MQTDLQPAGSSGVADGVANGVANKVTGLYEQAGGLLGDAVPWLEANHFLNNTLAAWAVALVAVAAIFVVLSFARGILLARAKRLHATHKTLLWDLGLRLILKTSVLIIAAVALAGGLRGLDLPAGVARAADILVIALLGAQVAIWATVVADWALVLFLSRQTSTTAEAAESTLRASMAAVRFLVLLAVYAMIALIAMDNFGVDVTALITGMGIGGIAVALASQKILGDVFGSLSITLDKPFELGDFIIVGTEMGTVENIGIKTTRLRALSGEQLVISNSDLLGSRVRNFKRMQERRVLFSLGVVYQTPIEKVRRIPGLIREAIESQPNTRFDRAHFQKFGASSLDFEAVYFMKVPDYNAYMDTQEKVNLFLAERFQDLGVDFAYPTQTLYVKPEPSAPPAGAIARQ